MVVMFALLVVALFFFIDRAKKAREIPIRRVPGLDALDECIGRATEMGRPVHYTMGLQDFEAETFASFEILRYAAGLCAKYDIPIIVTNYRAQVHPVTEEIVREAFVGEGKADAYKPDNVRFLSDNQLAYTAGCVGIMEREKVAANLLFGPFYAESLIFAEAGQKIGAIQIAGTARVAQLPFFVTTCDYTLLGEEIFAAGAYLSRDSVLLGSLLMQDLGKYIAVGLILIGSLLATAGNKIVTTLISK
jgi:hypothetical protein